jgi:hypothetical protein
MVLKRVTQTGWVTKRVAQPPTPVRPRLTHRVRLARETVIQTLLAEIASGNSMIKLYARLLAQEILTHDPELARKYRHQLEALEE